MKRRGGGINRPVPALSRLVPICLAMSRPLSLSRHVPRCLALPRAVLFSLLFCLAVSRAVPRCPAS